MMSDSLQDTGPFRLDRCDDLTPLRRALEDAGYTQSAVAATVGMDAASGKLCEPEVALRRTAANSPSNTLIRLFLMCQPVSEDAVRAALAPMDPKPLFEAGLLTRAAGGIKAQAALLPFEGLLLARDFWPEFIAEPCRGDHVPGVGPASLSLANLTVRRKGETALDLGTGLGVQALMAAAHASRVVATDSNPRALNFAGFNARLNGLSNIELRQGSLYEPVESGSFDLIVSNPPFVISPRLQYHYRDGGLPGDLLSERVVRGAAALLREGGFATILFNWHHRTENDWADRPSAWLSGSDCDTWLICSDTKDPLAYASGWLAYEHGREPDRYSRALDEWLSYYDDLGIGLISFGAVILRRRSAGRNWLRAERAPDGQATSSCSEQIQRIFAARDLLEGLAEEKDLLEKTFVLTADHQLEHVLQAEKGQWTVQRAQLKQTRGFPFTGNVDRLVSTVLAGCDGMRTVGCLVNDLAAGLGLNAEQIAPGCLAVIRKLLETGFLLEGRSAGAGK
jgi:methylase of polypeptide subunit release factors